MSNELDITPESQEELLKNLEYNLNLFARRILSKAINHINHSKLDQNTRNDIEGFKQLFRIYEQTVKEKLDNER